MSNLLHVLETENFSGAAVVAHGFTDYMRDYEIHVVGRNGPPFDDVHRYLFVGCVEAIVRSNVDPETFGQSIGDEFVYAGPDYPDKPEPNGFIWGVRYSTAHWGFILKKDSSRASEWSTSTKLAMSEITLSTEAFVIDLIFFDLRYEFLGQSQNLQKFNKSFPV